MAPAPISRPTPRPITRLLIANRGEIAVRIARTAHRLGIDTVGIYAEPDRDALHVDVVDVAVSLGGTTPADSYLRADAVLAAALDHGCDAVHPGYGFLAESATFAQQVLDAGLVWVGPTPDQIRLLGDKVAAKEAAIAAGVPTTAITAVAPGAIPDGVAMPALVKAAAGGGGRGMRIVRDAAELGDAVASAAREAEAAFGDGTVFIEPYIEHGRHVEVQIIGDRHGTVLHLGERECSIQRRNQKVVEESPSPGIDEATRTALCEGALALARHVGYENAGTVEFLVGAATDDGPGTVTFLEVNTRLQVEHPVTEAVTGLDLVELQLLVAAGEPLPLTQDDVACDGHAIEVRLVAEDPATGWLPSTGTVSRFDIGDGVRVDTGFRAGAEISADYDSLLAKVIAHAPTRTGAARTLARALRTSVVTGVETDLDCLVAILGEADFLAGATPTSYLDDHPTVAAAPGPVGPDLEALLIGAVLAAEHHARAADAITGFAPAGWRNLATRGQRATWTAGDDELSVEHAHAGTGIEVRIGPWPEPIEDGSLSADDRVVHCVRVLAHDVDVDGAGAGHRIAVEVDGTRRVVEVDLAGDVAIASASCGTRAFTRTPRFVDHEAEVAGDGPVSPLPGSVLSVHVAAGDHVTEGQLLVVVEAMKMEHKITAASDAVVVAVLFATGDRVDTGDLLVELADADVGGDAGGVTP